jgi:hypothetical protein
LGPAEAGGDAPGPGGGPDIRIFDGTTGKLVGQFSAYDPFFTGGVFVAVGDINKDGKGEIITGPDQGGGSDVRVFDGTGKLLQEFLAFGPFFTGGVRVAAGDVNGDGKADIITAASPTGGSNVVVFNGSNLSHQLQNFRAFGPFFQGGVRVAAADVDGDSVPEIPTAPGAGGGPNVETFTLSGQARVVDFLAYNQAFIGRVFVGAA